MTPKEALEHIKHRAFKDGPICHECAEANKILTELVYENSPRTVAEIREEMNNRINVIDQALLLITPDKLEHTVATHKKSELEQLLAFIDGEVKCDTSTISTGTSKSQWSLSRQKKEMNMSKWRKKPVTVEAWPCRLLIAAAQKKWIGMPEPVKQAYENGDVIFLPSGMLINTLEGQHEAKLDDWIIRGVKGELYPCKPDIFSQTYEPTLTEKLTDDKK